MSSINKTGPSSHDTKLGPDGFGSSDYSEKRPSEWPENIKSGDFAPCRKRRTTTNGRMEEGDSLR